MYHPRPNPLMNTSIPHQNYVQPMPQFHTSSEKRIFHPSTNLTLSQNQPLHISRHVSSNMSIGSTVLDRHKFPSQFMPTTDAPHFNKTF